MKSADFFSWVAEERLSTDDFCSWCDRHGLRTNACIADVFKVSSQTIRNWRKKDKEKFLPSWVRLACAGYEAYLETGHDGRTNFPPMTVNSFNRWKTRNGLDTCEQIGHVFGLTRQAVHNWSSRGHYPSYVSMACLGYEWLKKVPDPIKNIPITSTRKHEKLEEVVSSF